MRDETANEASELQAHQDAVGKGGALDIIREKELAINAKVLEARESADSIVAQARRDALAIKQRASDEGPERAKSYFQSEFAKAEKEAEAIKASVEAESKIVTSAGMKNLDKAIDKVLNVIIP